MRSGDAVGAAVACLGAMPVEARTPAAPLDTRNCLRFMEVFSFEVVLNLVCERGWVCKVEWERAGVAMNSGSVNATGKSPRVAAMRVVPVAGWDSMLLNLSGAHGPYFTRNLVLLNDTAGKTGAGEVPGGEAIREVLEQARSLVIGTKIGDMRRTLAAVMTAFANRDAKGRGLQTYDERIAIHAVAALEAALLDLLGK